MNIKTIANISPLLKTVKKLARNIHDIFHILSDLLRFTSAITMVQKKLKKLKWRLLNGLDVIANKSCLSSCMGFRYEKRRDFRVPVGS